MSSESTPLALPNQFLSCLRLLRALQGNGGGRDERIVRLALTYLETAHREHLLSRAISVDELWEVEMAHRGDRAYHALTRNSLVALRIAFWKLGVITDPGIRIRARAQRCPIVMELMEKHLGVDPAHTEFACLACGHLVRVPVGKTKKLVCPTCKNAINLGFNDGRRIAYSRLRRPSGSWVSVDSNPRLSPYEVLGITVIATVDEMKKAYRQQLMQCHPDKVYSLGCPIALWAAEEATRNLNEARRMIEQSAAR